MVLKIELLRPDWLETDEGDSDFFLHTLYIDY